MKEEEIRQFEKYKTDFQTPIEVCKYMVGLIPTGVVTVLEPTPGVGNIVSCLNEYYVTAPDDFFLVPKESKFDCIIMNPPFSGKFANTENAPINLKGMRMGYFILTRCMEMSNSIIALMPWFTISDSDVRLRYLTDFGLKSITALPRRTFEFARIQTCIFELSKGFTGTTSFHVYDRLNGKHYEKFKSQGKLAL